ncbi:MAG TPA: SLC13 family permease [Kiloniellales bacterium]|nr:SLC13 family permease [Kiloniellales bacterium]
MTAEQIEAVSLLAATLILFAWGRFRHDVVAMLSLMAAVALGLVEPDAAFAGFGHPAVITVAAVLVLGYAVAASGVIDAAVQRLMPRDASLSVQVLALGTMGALISSVMNNVGALALIMPVAIAAARKAGQPPSVLLMTVSLATMLGGLLTLIGTPSSLVVSDFRRQALGEGFGLFDITPIGLALVAAGLAFVALVGWRLIPLRSAPVAGELFGMATYVTEAKVKEGSKSIGKAFTELEQMPAVAGAHVMGIVRAGRRIPSTAWWERIQAGDVLVYQTSPENFPRVQEALDLEHLADPETGAAAIAGEGRLLLEAVVRPRAAIEGQTAQELRLRSRYGVDLVAVSRQGEAPSRRLKRFRFAIGDLLLLQGSPQALSTALSALGLLPIAERNLPPSRRRALPAIGFFLAGIVATASGLAPPAVALMAAALLTVIFRALPVRELYSAVDWSVIVLIGAMLPVGGTLESTGATDVIASWLLDVGQGAGPFLVLALLLVATLLLAEAVSNAATAVLMSPLAIGLSRGLEVQPDAFLMAVALGSACAFLTPIGHQNSTLIMGPGGFRFGDYWRLGVALEFLVVAIGVPLLPLLFPF